MERQEFRCESCGQSFGSATDLDKHNMRMHHGHSEAPEHDTPGGDRSPITTASGNDTENEDQETEEE